MNIRVKTLTGKAILISDLSSHDTIETLKEKIYELEGYPPACYELLFCGKEVSDKESVDDYQNRTILLKFRTIRPACTEGKTDRRED